ncbi:MAG: LysR family transcriptional regulator [Endozoicomonas sp.]
MKLEAVQAFLLTQETGSISAAARKMNKPRVLVSNWIAALEDEWDICLFDRSGYTPTLTPEGQSLLSVCQSLLATSGLLQRKVSSIQLEDEQTITLGIEESIEQVFLADVLEELEGRFPSLNISIKVAFDDELLNRIEAGEIDLAYTGLTAPDVQHFSCRQIGQYDFVAVCSVEHPLAGYESLDVPDLHCYRQISPRLHNPGAPDRRFSENFWQVSSYATALELVCRGLGWTICPRSLAIDGIRTGNLVILNHPLAVYRWPVGLVWRSGRQPGPVMQFLIEKITAHWNQT